MKTAYKGFLVLPSDGEHPYEYVHESDSIPIHGHANSLLEAMCRIDEHVKDLAKEKMK